MSVDLVKFAFIAGEISPTLYGRTDLTKFDLGVAEATNFFVDYRGGLSSRPGTRFMEFIKDDDKETRFFPFTFSIEEEDTHIILFGHNYIRFLQGGNYILQPAVSCTVAAGVVTRASHGLTAGRWIKVDGVAYEVRNPTANTFAIHRIPSGLLATDLTFTEYQAVYELASPYAATDLATLYFNQYRDTVRITSVDFAPRDLTRFDEANWTLTPSVISAFSQGPAISGGTASHIGTAEVIFAVTKILADGSESIMGDPFRLTGIRNYTAQEGSVSVEWPRAADAVSYHVYRSVVASGQTLSLGAELGYVGKTQGTKFTDPNIVPDFGKMPPLNRNPFTPGAINSITITNGGSGYTSAPAVAASGGGTGFVARAIVDDAGTVINVLILNGGQGYTSPGITFSGGGGSGAAATAVARPLTGTYPAISAVFQQRQLYAASLEEPITVWGSQVGRFSNFNSSEIVLATDAYEFTLDASGVSPIRHLFAMRGGVLAMTAENVWLLNGGTENRPITATNALAEPQTYTGVSNLRPLRIGSSLLYTEGKGYAVRELVYNEFSRVYTGQDRSILANHLFGPGKTIRTWGFQESPYKIVWCIREDGALLAFTTVAEEDVFAWTRCETRGRFLDLAIVREGAEDLVYVTTQRFINSRWTKFVERMDLRQFENLEDAWCVDCGLDYPLTYPAGTITVYNGDYALITGGSFAGTTNHVLRAAGGVWRVSSSTATRAELVRLVDPIDWVPETGEAYTFPLPQGEWSLTQPVSVINGLGHLEGETVSILTDASVVTPQVVTNGQITLPRPATRIIIGLPFSCRAKTLPLIAPGENIEGKRKRVIAVSMRLNNSRALKVGHAYDKVYELSRGNAPGWGDPIRAINGIAKTPVGSSWDEDAFTCFLLDEPLPATLLSLVQSMEVGDEGN